LSVSLALRSPFFAANKAAREAHETIEVRVRDNSAGNPPDIRGKPRE
jgi:hypothetical protein